MKKLLLGLGSIAAVVAPVAAVISCGDDSKTTPGTNGTQALDAAKQTTLKNNAATALGMTAADIDSVAKAATFGIEKAGQTKTLENAVIYNFKAGVTSIVVSNGAGSTSTITTDGGGQVIIGSSSTALRTGTTKHYYIATKVKSGGGDMNTLEEITDTTTLAAVKKDVLEVAFAPAADTTTPAAATDLTAAGASVWHGLFHKNHGRSLPEVGTKLEVTVNGTKLEYTWTAQDNTDLAGYTANPHTMGQTGVLNHLATKLKAATATTVSDIIAAFGVGHLHHHDMAVVAGQAKVTVALTAPAAGAKTQLSDVVSSVWTNADFGTSTTAADITLNGATLQVTFAANATPDDIKTAITTAVTSNSAFTNCFEA